ncbi:MAG: anti-sigma factor, partial [Bacteroidota bacterium]
VENALTLNLSGLEDLGSDYAYEGWLIVDGNPVSTGTFTVDGDGHLSQTQFDVTKANLEDATSFVLSIEPVPDSDPAPAATKILSGDFSGSSASVNTGLVADFSGAAGRFILATPTTTATNDDLSGVWFIDNGAAGLTLPTLADGWAYEGWAVINGTPVSTGTFTATDAADDSAPFSGTDAAGPSFPGEDFIMNAPSGLTFPTDLTNMPIVVSVEPVPDNNDGPFTLKPLSGSSPASGTAVGTPYDMTYDDATFPTGTVTKND